MSFLCWIIFVNLADRNQLVTSRFIQRCDLMRILNVLRKFQWFLWRYDFIWKNSSKDSIFYSRLAPANLVPTSTTDIDISASKDWIEKMHQTVRSMLCAKMWPSNDCVRYISKIIHAELHSIRHTRPACACDTMREKFQNYSIQYGINVINKFDIHSMLNAMWKKYGKKRMESESIRSQYTMANCE